MTNRTLAYIVKDQKPLIVGEQEPIQEACRQMWKRRCGSALVVDKERRLTGIFTGRDAVRSVADNDQSKRLIMRDVMTPNPVTITPEHRAIDALRSMSDGGFRHLPVIENEEIWGVVSRGDFKGMEIDRLDEEEHLWETIR
jgi:CBS domain-containing protein